MAAPLGVAAIAAQAGELYTREQYQAATASTNSRAQVKQSVLNAGANGGLDHNDVDLPALAKGSIRTRYEVRGEYFASRKQGINAPGRNTINYCSLNRGKERAPRRRLFFKHLVRQRGGVHL